MIPKTFLFMVLISISLITGCTKATTSGVPGSQSSISPHIYNKSYDVVFLAAVDAVSAMGWQITFTDMSSGVISAKVSANLWTWGDTVSVRVSRMSDQAVRVDLSSGTSPQLIDWGHNKRNILNYYGKLDSLIYSRGN